jgi:hypothetical protein
VADITGVRDLDNENIRNLSDYFFWLLAIHCSIIAEDE